MIIHFQSSTVCDPDITNAEADISRMYVLAVFKASSRQGGKTVFPVHIFGTK